MTATQQDKIEKAKDNLKKLEINVLVVGVLENGDLDSTVVYGKKQYFDAVEKYLDWRVWKITEIKKMIL